MIERIKTLAEVNTMAWTKHDFKNLLVGFLVAKSLRLLISSIAHSNGIEAGAYAPAIGWAVAALVMLWLWKSEPADDAATK
jgi:hypothetical protein